MDMIAWIITCLFASVGIVQCGIWTLDAFRTPKNMRRGYHVIPLYDDVEELEAGIRLRLSQVRGDGEFILLVDMGLGDESKEITDRLLLETGGVYICEKDALAETITHLDNLQTAANVVE